MVRASSLPRGILSGSNSECSGFLLCATVRKLRRPCPSVKFAFLSVILFKIRRSKDTPTALQGLVRSDGVKELLSPSSLALRLRRARPSVSHGLRSSPYEISGLVPSPLPARLPEASPDWQAVPWDRNVVFRRLGGRRVRRLVGSFPQFVLLAFAFPFHSPG